MLNHLKSPVIVGLVKQLRGNLRTNVLQTLTDRSRDDDSRRWLRSWLERFESSVTPQQRTSTLNAERTGRY